MLQETPLGGLHEITAAERSAAMHQRGHTYYGTGCGTGCAKAGRWAARRLITPRAFLTAGRTAHDLDGMAGMLSVLPDDVCAYLADLDVDEWLIMQRLIGHELR